MSGRRFNMFWYAVVVLLLANAVVWVLKLQTRQPSYGQLHFFDIGQGDAIFIEAPNGNQMMIDGGPGRIVLSELGKVMPFFDRSIDVLLVTNPDKDHIGGFVDILRRYKVKTLIEVCLETIEKKAEKPPKVRFIFYYQLHFFKLI